MRWCIKQSPELVRSYIANLNPRLSEKPYLNIVPIERLDRIAIQHHLLVSNDMD